MNASTMGVLGLAALLCAGCATLNGPQAYANAEAQREECKATVVTNTAESMRMQNRKGLQTDEMKRAEGALALARIKQNEPAALRQPIAPEESLTSKTLRGC
ncbi:MAG: hypothetical protein ACM3JC_11060 [Rudaea sp.]